MEKGYEKYLKKYNLPPKKQLEADFEISDIESDKVLLKEIAKKIVEKATNLSNMLEEILNPETRLTSMHESNSFSEEEKKRILRIFRKINFQCRKHAVIDLSYDEKETAEYITEFFNEWEKLKPELKTIIQKMQGSWNKDKQENLKLHYFG